MSARRLGEFKVDITRARDMVGLGQAIGAMTNGLVNSQDLYRAALVQGVAAWDRYVHGVVLDRAVEIMLGRMRTGKASKVGLPLDAIAVLMKATGQADRELAARSSLAERLSKETYQRPDEVAAGLAMVGVNAIWSTAFPDAEHAKVRLGVVVARRNRIVHHCDSNPVIPAAVVPLTAIDALDALQVVTDTVTAINPFCDLTDAGRTQRPRSDPTTTPGQGKAKPSGPRDDETPPR